MPLAEFSGTDSAIRDYALAASELFPLIEGADSAFLRSQYAIAFANIVGNPGEFYQYVTGSQGEQEAHVEKLLTHFRNNVALLAGKTWIDEEARKESAAVDKHLGLCLQSFSSRDYSAARKHFIELFGAISRLIFGAQSKQDDFIDYALRVDPKLGLFCWFVLEIAKKDRSAKAAAEDLCRVECLIGIYFLSTI